MTKIFSRVIVSLVFLMGGFCVYAEEAVIDSPQVNANIQEEVDLRPLEDDIDELRQELNDYRVESANRLEQVSEKALGFVASAEEYSSKAINIFLWVLGVVAAFFVFLGYKEIKRIAERSVGKFTKKTEEELKIFAETKKVDLENAFSLKESSLNSIIDSHSVELKRIEERAEKISDFSYYFSMGVSFRIGGHFKDALGNLGKALGYAHDPEKKLQCYFQRSLSYSGLAEKVEKEDPVKFLKYLESAMEEYKKILKIKKSINVFSNMGNIYVQMKKWDEAISNFEETQRLINDPEDEDYKIAGELLGLAIEEQKQSQLDLDQEK